MSLSLQYVDAPADTPALRFYPDVVQGSDEWYAMRCGLLTASDMKLVITPTLKIASNEKERAHLYELLAQRITRYVEPSFVGDSMLRGIEDEMTARAVYDKQYAKVTPMGFITNEKWGFTLGFSPDGLVGDDGFIECKSRRQKFQIETIADLSMPDDFLMQVQTGLLVSERRWCDFVSYCGGLPMITIRIHPDEAVQNAIIGAAAAFEDRLAKKWARYREAMASHSRLITTERRVEQEMYI